MILTCTRRRLLASAAAVCAVPLLYVGVADATTHDYTDDPQPIKPTYYQLQTPSRTYGDLSKGPIVEVVDVPNFGTCLIYQQTVACK